MIPLFQTIYSGLRQESLFERVVRNSGYLLSSNVIVAALGVLQQILVVSLLGDSKYGLLVIVMDFASNTNRLLSFRMSEVVVRYVGEALAQGNRARAASLVKWMGLLEAGMSVAAYLVLFALSLWAAQRLADDASVVSLFRFYGLFLLANLVYETSLGVLQSTDRFKLVAQANFYQSIVVTALIVAAFLSGLGILGVLTAYLCLCRARAEPAAGRRLDPSTSATGRRLEIHPAVRSEHQPEWNGQPVCAR